MQRFYILFLLTIFCSILFLDIDSPTVCSARLSMPCILGRKPFFICSLTASRLALGHYQGDSLNQPMLISAYFHILTQRSIFIISLETIKFSDELIWRDISEFTSVKTKIFSKQGHVDSVRSPTLTFQKIRLYLLQWKPLKMMKNAFPFILKALFSLPEFFGHGKKRLDKKAKITFKMQDVISWETIQFILCPIS